MATLATLVVVVVVVVLQSSGQNSTLSPSTKYIETQIKDRGLGHPSCFEPDVQIEVNDGEDHFYALVYERFWDTMLPALERVSAVCV